MDNFDQLQIIQEIINRVTAAAEYGWSELIITYHVEGQQSEFGNSYLITLDGVTREKSLVVAHDLDSWLRRLQSELAKGSKQSFTSCRLHLYADGRFDISYCYDPVDWDGLIFAGWNFSSVTSLH